MCDEVVIVKVVSQIGDISEALAGDNDESIEYRFVGKAISSVSCARQVIIQHIEKSAMWRFSGM